MDKKKTTRKVRRTNEQLVNDILDATESMVAKQGFIDIPLTKFVSEAGIDPNVFYRRYTTIYDIYDELAKKYDFWVNDTIDLSKQKKLGDRHFMAETLKELHNNLKCNSVMQKLLLWELNEINETTKRTSALRDTMNPSLLNYYGQIFKDSEINIHGILALFIAGIYYLTLHRGIATFCYIDFSTKEGIEVLNSTIDQLIDVLFVHIEHNKNQVRIVKEMAQDGIPYENICKYMDITLSELKLILANS